MDELVDHALVAGLRRAAGLLGRVGDLDEPVFIAGVGRGGHHVEFGGVGGVVRGKYDFLRAHGDVQAVLVAQRVHHAVHRHLARAAHVEHAGLAALQEVVGAEAVPDVDAVVDGQRLVRGRDAHGDHAVHVAVHRDHLARHEQRFDQELPRVSSVV